MKSAPYTGELLTDEQLKGLPTHRLLRLYKVKRSFLPSRDDEQLKYRDKSMVYANRIKAVLNTREHVEK